MAASTHRLPDRARRFLRGAGLALGIAGLAASSLENVLSGHEHVSRASSFHHHHFHLAPHGHPEEPPDHDHDHDHDQGKPRPDDDAQATVPAGAPLGQREAPVTPPEPLAFLASVAPAPAQPRALRITLQPARPRGPPFSLAPVTLT